MGNIDEIYQVELNFIDEFNLSKTGMIEEIKTEFDIIRLCIQEISKLDAEYERIIDRIMVMPLRKLLCEKNSVLLKVYPNFKMPPLRGNISVLLDGLTIIRPPFLVESIDQWISIDQWLQQNIAWLDRKAENIAKMLPKYSYECITIN